MRVLIVGAGRSGSNWAMEIVRASGRFQFTERSQDAYFFERTIGLPFGGEFHPEESQNFHENYGSKLPTEHPDFNMKNMKGVLKKYPGLKMIWTLRHPIDMALSKMYRGQPLEKGGDKAGYSPDATLTGALYAIEYMYLMYTHMTNRWGDKILTVRLEDLILNTNKPVTDICNFLNVIRRPHMMEAHKLIRVPIKHKRYRGVVDKTQANIRDRWDTIYDGFFKNRGEDVKTLKKELGYVVEGLGYG